MKVANCGMDTNVALKVSVQHRHDCKAADAIDDLITALTASNEVIAKNKPKWIPVTERLPKESGSCLIVDSGHVTEAYYGKEWAGDNWTDPVEMYMTFHPTHWMPLPQPPESDGE